MILMVRSTHLYPPNRHLFIQPCSGTHFHIRSLRLPDGQRTMHALLKWLNTFCRDNPTILRVQFNLSRPPNGADLHRFRLPIWYGASYSDTRANVIRDDSSRLEKRQLGPTETPRRRPSVFKHPT